MRGADDSIRPIPIVALERLRRAQIYQIHLSLVVDYRVFGFDVPVDDIFGVQVLHSKQQRPEVEPGDDFVQYPDFPDSLEHLYSIDVLEQKINVLPILVCLIIAHDQGVADAREYLTL